MAHESHLCFSGGAPGADTAWGDVADSHDHRVCHYSFAGHRTACNYRWILTETQLKSADPFLVRANVTLKRKFPTRDEDINNLLRRDYFQVYATERVYAVAPLLDDKIEGGTAWAVQMAMDRGLAEIYLFDLVTNSWYHWVEADWRKILRPPVPHGLYTGIGSRRLTAAGLQAIVEVYDNLP